MIIQGEDWLFVHNPKCAGTNIKHILSKSIDRSAGHTHLGLRDFSTELQKKWTFAFVRNPFDRMVSIYEFIRARLAANSSAHYGWVHDITAANRPFNEWLMNSEFWEDNFRKGEIVPVQQRSQSYFVTLNDKDIAVDFVGKVESFDKDMREVCKHLRYPFKDSRLNSNPHKSYREYYDAESKAWIEKYFQWDLETFGYEY